MQFYFMTPDGAQITYILLSLIYFVLFVDILAIIRVDTPPRKTSQKIYLTIYGVACLVAAFAFSFSVAFTGDNPYLDRDAWVEWVWLLWFVHMVTLAVPVITGTAGIFLLAAQAAKGTGGVDDRKA